MVLVSGGGSRVLWREWPPSHSRQDGGEYEFLNHFDSSDACWTLAWCSALRRLVHLLNIGFEFVSSVRALMVHEGKAVPLLEHYNEELATKAKVSKPRRMIRREATSNPDDWGPPTRTANPVDKKGFGF